MKFIRTPNKYFYCKRAKKIIVFRRGKEPGRSYFLGITNEESLGIPRRKWTLFEMFECGFLEIGKKKAKELMDDIP